jgi:hypothetical protein
MTILKRVVDGFSYIFFLLISVILFSNQDHPWYQFVFLKVLTFFQDEMPL